MKRSLMIAEMMFRLNDGRQVYLSDINTDMIERGVKLLGGDWETVAVLPDGFIDELLDLLHEWDLYTPPDDGEGA